MIGRVLSHYRVVEQIGSGGMGVVYRAHDEQLERDVAIKVLPAGMLANDQARKQFRQEALALAKLNHPNIGTIFEFCSAEGIDFLAMELMTGQSMSERLNAGPFSAKDVMRLGIQFADALAAAHERGIVHRDLKPGNLFITEDGRLKILDFGLAKIVHADEASAATRTTVTSSGTASGTAPYMPPEQLRGQPVDSRADIYAAGAVLYEMACGRRPFRETQSAQLIAAILMQTPPAPSSLNPLVPPGLDSVIMKSLEKEPAQRYQTARELRASLESLSNATLQQTGHGMAGAIAGAPVSPAGRRIPTPVYAAGGGLAIILVCGILIGLNFHGLRDRLMRKNADVRFDAAPEVHPRRSVAVIGFRNVSGQEDKAWLSTALSEMLTTELAAGNQLRTVPGENVAQMKANLSLPDADSYGRETLGRIRKNINADAVVVGSYVPLGKGQIRLDLQLQNAEDGETLVAVSEKGSEDQIDDLVSRAGVELRQNLGVGAVSQAETEEVKAALPASPEAARLYAEGLAKSRNFDYIAARDLLERVVAIEPKFVPAHSALANTWQSLGYDSKAKDEAKKAFDLAGNLSKEDRLLAEGRYHSILSDHEKAAESYRALFQEFPDNVAYGLRLAEEEQSAGQFQPALDTIDQLRKLPEPASQDPRIDLQEAEVTENKGDYKRAETAAIRAQGKAQLEGAKLLEASSLFFQCIGFYNLGQPNDAIQACSDSNRIYAAAGDRYHAASALNTMGNVQVEQSEFAKAQANYEEALRVWRAIGNQEGVAAAYANLAMVHQDQGNFKAAQPFYEQALAAYREIGSKHLEGIALGNYGNLLQAEWDLAGARAKLEQSLAIARETGDKDQESTQLLNLASLSKVMGDLKSAQASLDQAEPLLRDSGRKLDTATFLTSSNEILYLQGDLAGAREKEQEALRLRMESGNPGDAAYSQLNLADLAVEEGHPADAIGPVRSAIQEFQKEHDEDSELDGHSSLIAAYLAMGNIPANLAAAQKEVEAARPLAAKTQNRGSRLDFMIAAARLDAALGRSQQSVTSLNAVLAEAERIGSVPLQFEARLRLGEIEMQSGRAAAGRARLASLEKDATNKGFVLFARKARAALS
jgi:eukaryotic-like serine/threonine-protein kinase